MDPYSYEPELNSVAKSRIWSGNYSFHETFFQSTPLDKSNEYVHNSLGYRGVEFSGQDVLVSGCSMTYGEGVPYEKTWGTIISEKLGYGENYANLGIRGASVSAIIYRTIAYIKKFGLPKYLFILFPNMERIEMPFTHEAQENFTSGFFEPYQVADSYLSMHINARQMNPPKYMKAPYKVEEVLPADYVSLNNMDLIRMFEELCKAWGITYRWAFWHLETDNFYRTYARDYISNNYVYFLEPTVKIKNIESDTKKPICHVEDFEKYGENFFYGLDALYDGSAKNNAPPHWGTHVHVHAAEAFLQSLLQQ
jgi:hypothetical protein